MTCEQARQRWMEDELNPEVRRHQAACAACREAAAEHVALLNLMDEWAPPQEVHPGFEARLYQRIREEEAIEARRNSWRSWTGWLQPARLTFAGAILSLLLIFVGGVYHANHNQPQSPLPIAQVAQSDPVVRDLQVLDQDSDMLENFDFLSGSVPDATQADQTDNR